MGYLYEPFNPANYLGGFASPFKTWFQYVTAENSSHYEHYLADLIGFKYPVRTNLTHSRSAMDVAASLRGFAEFSMHRLRRDTAVMKDPIALFSAPWLARHFDMNVVVMIRHPAAFCSSLKIMNWAFDFNNLLKQTELIRETRLADFEHEIRKFATDEYDIIMQAALLWNCMHAVIDDYRMRYPGWLFLKHEELSLEPAETFQHVYAKLGLDFTTGVQAAIAASSGEHNPAEQIKGKEFRRNSKASVMNWKSRLTDREILIIKEQTRDFWELFYSDTDW